MHRLAPTCRLLEEDDQLAPRVYWFVDRAQAVGTIELHDIPMDPVMVSDINLSSLVLETDHATSHSMKCILFLRCLLP